MLWILMVSLWLFTGGFWSYMDWKKSFNEVDVCYICIGAWLGPIILVIIIPHMQFWKY